MKLNKILMPALSIASVGAIVTPIVTSCNKTVGISMTKIAENTWTSGENRIKFKAGQTVSYTGKDLVMPESNNKYLLIDTFNQDYEIFTINTISVNNKQLTVQKDTSTGFDVYYCDLSLAGIKENAPLVINVTYKDAGVDCATVINIDNTI